MRRRRLGGLGLGLCLGMAGVVSTVSGASAATSTATGPTITDPGRTVTLRARTETLQPRVISLKPRVRNIAPKRRGGTFTVSSDVLFAFDSAALSSDAKAVLADVLSNLRRHRSGTVTVSGYTDAIGSAAYNLGLSRRRADAVRSLLSHQLPGGLHFIIHGYGKSRPVASNATAAGRQANRRVTVRFTPG